MLHLLLSVLAVLVAISMVPTILSDPINQPIGDFTVPSWIKNTAGWWADGQIDDSSFVSGIQWLILNDVITIPSTQQGAGDGDNIIPSWVKNTAGWWAEDKIHDITFVSAIRYLINEGIMIVVQVSEPEPAKCTFKGLQVPCPAVKEVEEITDFYMEVNGSNCCLNWAYVGNDYRFQIETFDKKHGNQIDGVTITAKIISKGGELRHDFGQVTTEDGIYKNSITIPSMDWYAGNILSVTAEYNGFEKTIEKEFEVFPKKTGKGQWQVRSMVALDAETDGANGFTELNDAYGVDTFTIGSSTYAIVASFTDDGVQIIDISDPTAIVAKDAATDGDTFTELDGASSVDTFTIGSSTYAIVVSQNDNGVQIIDISDPTAIVAKDAQTDGDSGGFDTLDGAHGVETFVIGSSTYAIVASYDDDGVQILNITDPTTITATDDETDGANGFTELDGAHGVATFTIDSSTYAIVASFTDDGVQIIDISDPTAIVAKDTATDGDTFTELEGAWGVDTFTIGSSTYAIVVTYTDNGVQIIDISDPTAIVAKDAETDGVNGFTELDTPEDVDIFTCGSRTYAMVASPVGDGVQMIDISNPANIIAVDAATDGVNGFTELDGVISVDTFTIGSTQYAIAASYTDDGVQMIGMACSRS